MNKWVEGSGKVDGMDEYNRQLIHVPILHCPADMGTLREGLELAYVGQFGRRRWEEHVVLIEKFWQTVRTELGELDLNYHCVDLYQDGLPVCGKELQIAEETAAKGSENYQLLIDLIARGATLMGTEDTKLLLQEYCSLKEGLAMKLSDDHFAKNVSDGGHAAELLAKRDGYIARRIGETLLPGRTGILFMGMMHKVDLHLPGDILIMSLNLDVAKNQDNSSG
jgi:hypothetical protein